MVTTMSDWIKFIPGDKLPEPWEFVDVKFLNGNEGVSLHVGTINWETVARYRLVGSQPAMPPMAVPAAVQPEDPIPDDYKWNAGIYTGCTYAMFKDRGWTNKELQDHGYLIPVTPPWVDELNISIYKQDPSQPTFEEIVSAPLTSSSGTCIDPSSRYYDAGGIETIDVIKAKLTPEQLKGYLLGNVIKYSSRLNFKGTALRDAEKLKFYSAWLEQLK